MTVYIIRRLLQTVVMMIILSVLFFLLVRFQPSSACSYTAYGCQEMLNLDEPVTSQYLAYVGNLLHGNFGSSSGSFVGGLSAGQPIGTEIANRLPPTIILVGVSFLLQQLIALPLGMLAALRQYSAYDQGLTFLSYIFLSTPAFVLGTVCLYVFAFLLGWLPLGHNEDLALPFVGTGDWFSMLRQDPGLMLGDLVRHLILPAFVLMVTGIAVDSRFMRGAMLQVLHQDYIRTATAKGLPRRRIIFKHAFRNALLPIVTNIGLYLPSLIGGVVVVESVFTFGGVGQLFALATHDFATLQALLVLSALTVLLANLLADIAYALLDPRIRFDSTGAE
jgi:peptide/nickel transport system permease protein